MSIKNLYINVNRKAHEISRYFWFKRNDELHYKWARDANIEIQKLTKTQKEEIDKVWGGFGIRNYATHELIYSATGIFNPLYCPTMLFGTKLEFMLNNQDYVTAWSDKNYFDKFFPEVTFPYAVARNIQGEFYDHNYKQIKRSDVKSILSEYKRVCIKPTLDSGTGTGVRLVEVDNNIERVIDTYRQDYVIQEVLEQYESISALNQSSVNVVRVNSVFLNGKVSVVSSTLRCGEKGAFNDNSITSDGKGMFFIGVDEKGCLRDKAYYPCGESMSKAPNEETFSKVVLPNYDKVIELVTHIHSQMPFVGFVGFDVAFDPNGDPVIMEYNLKAPGVFYYQLANGPLFGNRTQEVIDTFLRKKQN